MQLGFDVSVNGKQVQDSGFALDISAQHVEQIMDTIMPEIKSALLETLQRVAAKLVELHGNPWPGTVASDSKTLYRRSGYGLDFIKQSIDVSGAGMDELVGVIKAPSYMMAHEDGGIVRASGSKFLAIPLPAAMDGRGNKLRQRATDWPNTFIHRGKSGALLIFQRRGAEVVPLYILKPSIYLRPRLKMVETMDDELPYFEKKIFDALTRAAQKED